MIRPIIKPPAVPGVSTPSAPSAPTTARIVAAVTTAAVARGAIVASTQVTGLFFGLSKAGISKFRSWCTNRGKYYKIVDGHFCISGAKAWALSPSGFAIRYYGSLPLPSGKKTFRRASISVPQKSGAIASKPTGTTGAYYSGAVNKPVSGGTKMYQAGPGLTLKQRALAGAAKPQGYYSTGSGTTTTPTAAVVKKAAAVKDTTTRNVALVGGAAVAAVLLAKLL